MSLLVMKYGGSSVGDAERIKRVARRIADRRQEGHQCVVVVSAMGDTTDDLIELSKQIAETTPSAREMDMLLSTGEQVAVALLSMALHVLGEQAISLTGWQAGILTEANHGKARIIDIQTDRIRNALNQGNVVIIAGFQGATENGEITTLGRGGSDTTAVALAAAIRADLCEIYTDVDGVYSTDPRIVKLARKLKEISYDEMLEMAHLGAAVLHPRAVECAKQNKVKLVVRSSFTNHEGTQVKEETDMEQGIVVRGIAFDKPIAHVSLLDMPTSPNRLATVFNSLAKDDIDVDLIVQGGIRNGKADLSFTVSLADLEKAKSVLDLIQADVGFKNLEAHSDLVKVSIVGAGMVSSPGIAATMFHTIAETGVSIHTVSTSEIKISCVIEGTKLHEVVRSLHTVFELDDREWS
ncbi:aspartate kinase [Paenibacillus sp. FSL H7-0716]|uniref:Aspartokinase n=1 Tax=Paenibacillus odorifer TaxID=189426 RepID=A0A1R0XYA1_9BACL|nr:aspartate kinase [Paenibacillus odorifer]OMD40068.1 aspartate kinase [Paenibacillus odorifer]OME19816.1 aspartate kinase [Paenibacillus odorifer]